MNRKTTLSLAILASFATMPAMVFGQSVQPSQAVASSDVLSQISRYSYRDGPKSRLLFRGTPIAATAEVQNLPDAAPLSPYTTYLLRALTPDGQRATTVRDFLVGQGVPASSIDIAGLGFAMPIGGNSSVEGRARNRRVEIVNSGEPLAAATDTAGASPLSPSVARR